MFLISSTEKSTSESDFSVIKGKSDGNALPLSISEHCFTKKDLLGPTDKEGSKKDLPGQLTWKQSHSPYV